MIYIFWVSVLADDFEIRIYCAFFSIVTLSHDVLFFCWLFSYFFLMLAGIIWAKRIKYWRFFFSFVSRSRFFSLPPACGTAAVPSTPSFMASWIVPFEQSTRKCFPSSPPPILWESRLLLTARPMTAKRCPAAKMPHKSKSGDIPGGFLVPLFPSKFSLCSLVL